MKQTTTSRLLRRPEANETRRILHDALVAAVERFGLPAPEEGHGPLALFHCPMAFDFEGADWLGETGPVENPYFGSEMPHCGSLVRELELQGER